MPSQVDMVVSELKDTINVLITEINSLKGDISLLKGDQEDLRSKLFKKYTNSNAVRAMGSKEDENPLHHDRYEDSEAISAVNIDNKYVKKDGSEILTSDWDIGDTRKILGDEIRARDGDGLKLHDDGGNGIFVEDGGNVGIGIANPSALLHLSSALPIIKLNDTSDNRIGIIEWTTRGYGDSFRFWLGDDGAYPGFWAQKQSLIGTDDVLFLVYSNIINSNFIFEHYTGKHFYIQTRNPESSSAGDLIFRTGIYGDYINSAEKMRIKASNGYVGIGNITATATLDVDSDIFRTRTAKTPASAGAAGNTGDRAWDANFFYLCIATNSWRRTAHNVW